MLFPWPCKQKKRNDQVVPFFSAAAKVVAMVPITFYFTSTNAMGDLQRVVHIELNRMRRHAEAGHFLHFELNISIDHFV